MGGKGSPLQVNQARIQQKTRQATSGCGTLCDSIRYIECGALLLPIPNQTTMHAIFMVNVFSGSLVAILKFLSVASAGKISIAVALILWHQANGSYRFCQLAHTFPFLALELRIWLNFHNWLTRLSQLARHHGNRNLPPPAPSMEFLLWRDGHTIFDYFKTLSFSGISPPAIA